jgi:hypothetical protein
MAAEQVDPRLDHRHSDLEFLKDQVQRLSDALSRYQEKYPPVSTDGQVRTLGVLCLLCVYRFHCDPSCGLATLAWAAELGRSQTSVAVQ